MSYVDNCKDKEMIAEDLLGQRKCVCGGGGGGCVGRGDRVTWGKMPTVPLGNCPEKQGS